MLGVGLYASDEVMKSYVDFICSHIPTYCGVCVDKTNGFPMKGCYVPAVVEITEKFNSHVMARIVVLNHRKEFIFFMSRHQSPMHLLHSFQNKLNDITGIIIDENNLDRDKIFSDHHPLKNLKLPNNENKIS